MTDDAYPIDPDDAMCGERTDPKQPSMEQIQWAVDHLDRHFAWSFVMGVDRLPSGADLTPADP